MKIKMDGFEFKGTPIQILDDLKTKAWDAEEYTNTEEYLEYLRSLYRRMCDEELQLPEGTFEEKAKAALKALADIGLLEIEEE